MGDVPKEAKINQMTAKTLNRNYRLKAANDIGNDASLVIGGALKANDELRKKDSLKIIDIESCFIDPKKQKQLELERERDRMPKHIQEKNDRI